MEQFSRDARYGAATGNVLAVQLFYHQLALALTCFDLEERDEF